MIRRDTPLVLFDIDGTLVHCGPTHCGPTPRRAFKRALEQTFGTAGPIDSWIFDGKTDPMIVRELMAAAGVACDQERIDQALGRYARDLEHQLAAEPARKVYPGVPGLLDGLDKTGVPLGLLTGNIRAGALAKLSSLGLWHRFAFGAFADDSAVRRELADVAVARAFDHSGRRFTGKKIVIIGDTEHDVACGRHLGAKAIGVGTGRATREQLLAHGADHAFADLSDTAAVLAAIMG
ncbi:MAG: haloacid dehalogenase-like hydrolase [Candidatus Edwardsbacteria bacterium]|nr:haloacid dehalogenase-like hydrolase [Candidatus Edwardsbacteria bacterium]